MERWSLHNAVTAQEWMALEWSLLLNGVKITPSFLQCAVSSLCCGDSNCYLFACNWAFLSSLPSLCCGDSNCRLLAYNWAFFNSLPSFCCELSLPCFNRACFSSLHSLTIDSSCCLQSWCWCLLWWNFASSSSFRDSALSLSLSFSEHFLFALSIIFIRYLSLNSYPCTRKIEKLK